MTEQYQSPPLRLPIVGKDGKVIPTWRDWFAKVVHSTVTKVIVLEENMDNAEQALFLVPTESKMGDLLKRIEDLENALQFVSGPKDSSLLKRLDSLESLISGGPREIMQNAALAPWRCPAVGPDYLRILANGDTYFVGGAGLPFGEIYYHGAGTSLAMAAQDTWYQFVGFDTAGESNLTTISVANSDITIQKTGKYLVSLNSSIWSATAIDWVIGVFKNNGATALDMACTSVTTIAGAKALNASVTAIVALTEGDTIEVWAERITGAGVLKTLTFGHAILNITMIGG